ncbi:hypothetical protein [Candidatus Jettenia sp. AMX1]|nr:hypothetical protein [Candidatus Jettenia sp. AMX1]
MHTTEHTFQVTVHDASETKIITGENNAGAGLKPAPTNMEEKPCLHEEG